MTFHSTHWRTLSVASLVFLSGCGDSSSHAPERPTSATHGRTIETSAPSTSAAAPGRAPRPQHTDAAQARDSANVMRELRQRALGYRSTGDSKMLEGDIIGLVTDWGLGPDGAFATIVCMNDGSASLYFSSGGGIIGAGEHDSVRAKMLLVLQAAQRAMPGLASIDQVPDVSPEQMQFTVLTEGGMKSKAAPTEMLAKGSGPLTDLHNAVQALIFEIRVASEKASDEPGKRK